MIVTFPYSYSVQEGMRMGKGGRRRGEEGRGRKEGRRRMGKGGMGKDS